MAKLSLLSREIQVGAQIQLASGGDHLEPLVLLEPAFASPVTRATEPAFSLPAQRTEFPVLRTTVLKSSCDATIVERS